MKNSKKEAGDVNRSHEKSTVQKLIFVLGHLIIVLFCTWLVCYSGSENIGNFFGKTLGFSDPSRAKILLACTFLYWFRHVLTLFYLLQRKVDWSEVFGLLVFFALFEIGLVLLGGGVFRGNNIPFNFLDMIALVLLLSGSYLNSFSEIERKKWKTYPENKGRCYTKGLFSYSMHINFFGDTILFTGWCMFTHNYWSLGLPLFMASMFIFFHIPNLDEYLAKRYGKEFYGYSKITKKFIPYIY